ncbi:MAG: transposase [Candidatus Eiseniibacteriota bacterium]
MPQKTAKFRPGRFAALVDREMAARLAPARHPDRAARARADAELLPSRVFANALVNSAWRNEPVEDIHAGRRHDYPLAPTDPEVARLLTAIRARILRLLARRGQSPDADVAPPDSVAEESPALASFSAASVQGRVALGSRAGARLMALGRDPEAQWVTSGGPRQAHVDGFDLHANVAVPGEDRERLEQLCRYLLRPAVAQNRLRLTEDGRIVLELKTAWADGTSYLVFEPLDFLARLASLTPRPRINLIFYHGVLAPHAGWRAAVVSYGVAAAGDPVPPAEVSAGTDASGEGGTATRAPRRGWTWAQLMRRAFEIDVLACPACGGRLRLIALILDPRTIRALLLSRGVPTAGADRAPPVRPPCATSGALS